MAEKVLNNIDKININKIQRFKASKYAILLYDTYKIKHGFHIKTLISWIEDNLKIIIDGVEVELKTCISYTDNKVTQEFRNYWSYQITDTKIDLYMEDDEEQYDDENPKLIYVYNTVNIDKTGFKLKLYNLENKNESIEELTNFIMFIYSEIEQLYFDNEVGYFRRKKNKEIIQYRQELFKKFLPIPEECCICYCNTQVKTMCDHSLCIICWKKLFLRHEYPTCPICRNCIIQYKSVHKIQV